jgi:predicted Zn-dependent peptidase
MVIAVCSVPVQSARAQEHGTSMSQVVRLNQAPVNKEVLKVQLPRPTQTKLSNGLTLLLLEQHKLPTVSLALWIKAGALADPKDIPGLAKFTADMLHEGTSHRSSAQLAAEVDEIGGTLNANAAFGSSISTLSASTLVENTGRLLDLMSDVVLNPTFPADELEKYRQRQLANLEQQRSQPQFLANEKFRQVLYRGFPASVVSATPDSLRKATPELLKKFHDEYYAPNNAILGVVGDFKTADMIADIKKYFGEWKSNSIPALNLGSLPSPAPSKIYLVNRHDSVQTNIVAGDYAVRRADPEYVPLQVANQVLGGGPQARLFLNLRENKGYTYGVFSSFSADIYPGPWAARTEVRTNVTDGSMHELLAEFQRLRDERVPDAELDDARRSIVARFALELENPVSLINDWLTVNYYALPQDHWDRYPEQIAQVNGDAVQAAARKYMERDHMQIVCVGDGKQIKEVLKKYGPVEEYDTDGKKLE